MATSLPIATNWADAWIDALASFSQPGRMRRGQRFADKRHVRKLDIQPGRVQATVHDDDQTARVDIRLQPFDDATWERILQALASQARFSARLLAGEMPPEVIEVFTEAGIELFPDAESMQATCTCPDWEVPCKHTAAVYYMLARQFEEDPFQLFLLRGRSREQLLASLRQLRQVISEEAALLQATQTPLVPSLQESIANFWDVGAELDHLSFNFNPPTTTMPHLRRLGSPHFTSLDLLELLAPIYDTITTATLAQAFQEEKPQS